jgi:hypothetical protein
MEEDWMRYALGLALLLLPATAFAQMFEGPTNTIPAAKCEQGGVACSPVVDAAGLTKSRGYVRVDPNIAVAPSRLATDRNKSPYLVR